MNTHDPIEPVDALSHGALRHDIGRRLLRAIFQGELPAGTRLVAKQLSERFGVSPTPIREALVGLEQAGVIEIQHNRGAVVKPFGREQLREVYHVHRILESEAARNACGRISPATLATSQAETQRLIAALARDGSEWLAEAAVADDRFHGLLGTHCGNARLANEIGRYQMLVVALREAVGNRPPVHRQAVEDHPAIIAALLAGDGDRAAMAMAHHIDRVGQGVESVLFDGER
ncbi:MAG: GntR family transcriptional regulator [Thermoguttaceae bacterium]|jgi:DNA-binding GntR family transcriptional regulator